MKTIRAKEAKVYFAYFVQRNQLGIIAEHLPNAKFVAAVVELPSIGCHSYNTCQVLAI